MERRNPTAAAAARPITTSTTMQKRVVAERKEGQMEGQTEGPTPTGEDQPLAKRKEANEKYYVMY